jgi:hypothetical protein
MRITKIPWSKLTEGGLPFSDGLAGVLCSGIGFGSGVGSLVGGCGLAGAVAEGAAGAGSAQGLGV